MMTNSWFDRVPTLKVCFCALAVVLLAGCLFPRSRAVPEMSRGTTASFHGWRGCLRLDNGLVRVTAVPQVGGRILEFSLDRHNFLAVGRAELGTTIEDDPTRRYRHFGGRFTQLHPEERWQKAQSTYPRGLFMGAYEAALDPDGPVAAATLTLAFEKATGTRIDRRIELFPRSTRLRITDKLTNLRLVPQTWGIHDFIQLKGAPVRSGLLRGSERPEGQMGLYVPLNPQSRYPGGFEPVFGDRKARQLVDEQWSTVAYPGLLALRYHRQFGKVLLDPDLPWVAFVDHEASMVFVQRCAAPAKAILAAGPPLDALPMIEVQSLGPARSLAPRESTTLAQDWFAARCPGPVLDVTDAGVVARPLSLLRDGARTWVEGTFGVFYVGSASVVFRDSDGKELERSSVGSVDPRAIIRLDHTVDLPPRTAEVSLEVADPDGRPIGHLGIITLGAP
jgi:hypothetical protein